MSPNKSFSINCAEIELLDDGIILLNYKSSYPVELKDVKEVESALVSFSEGGDIYCLMDTSNRFSNFSNEAQNYLSKEASIVKEGKLKCSAVVIDNVANRLLIKFFSRVFKPKFKMKVFSNQKSALEWLRSEL